VPALVGYSFRMMLMPHRKSTVSLGRVGLRAHRVGGCGEGSLVHSFHLRSTSPPQRRSVIPDGHLEVALPNKGGEEQGVMQANRPIATTRELRLRPYGLWVNTGNAAKRPDDSANDPDDASCVVRPPHGRQQIFNHQLCDEASNKGSHKQRGGQSQNGVKDARNAETAEKGMSGKAKMKRRAQAMLRYWLRRAAHPQGRMRPGVLEPMMGCKESLV
jgi:hypothetical protein